MLRWSSGVGVGWGGMLTFMLRWWCYADHLGLGRGGVGCQRSCYADDVTLIIWVGVGWGGMLMFMLRWWCYADHLGLGWGGGGDVNVHVTLMMLRWSSGVGEGWGGMLTFMLRWWCYADHLGLGWGGVDVNVHVALMMLRWSSGVGGGVGWDVNVHVTLMMLRWSSGVGGGLLRSEVLGAVCVHLLSMLMVREERIWGWGGWVCVNCWYIYCII